MKEALVTGAKGQLGKELYKLAPSFPGLKLDFIDVDELDLTDPDAVDRFFKNKSYHCLINCAGYTAVDKAEEEPELANLVNGYAVELLAKKAYELNAFLIHISTDFVFDGYKSEPYTETDKPNPQSAYARSKLLGEASFMKYAAKGAIIRTSWLYSEYGHNFVKTMMKYGEERDNLQVVFDQIGTPTYAFDLASMILNMLSSSKIENQKAIFHYANEGVASWYDFAKAVIGICGIECNVYPVLTNEYPLPARRPQYSVMSKALVKKELGIHIPYWRDSLERCIQRIKNN